MKIQMMRASTIAAARTTICAVLPGTSTGARRPVSTAKATKKMKRKTPTTPTNVLPSRSCPEPGTNAPKSLFRVSVPLWKSTTWSSFSRFVASETPSRFR